MFAHITISAKWWLRPSINNQIKYLDLIRDVAIPKPHKNILFPVSDFIWQQIANNYDAFAWVETCLLTSDSSLFIPYYRPGAREICARVGVPRPGQ